MSRPSGKTVVFTGALKEMTREQAEAMANRLGAKAAGSASKNNDYLMAGPSVMPKAMPPSICAATVSGLTTRPRSMQGHSSPRRRNWALPSSRKTNGLRLSMRNGEWALQRDKLRWSRGLANMSHG
jgi:hypothetical protein